MLRLTHEEYQNLITMGQADLRDQRLMVLSARAQIQELEAKVAALEAENHDLKAEKKVPQKQKKAVSDLSQQ